MPVTAELRRLLNETSDCLDAPDCTLVRKLCLDRLFTHLVLSLETPFRPALDAGPSAQGSRFEDVTERTTRLASLLPTVARQSHVILNSMPNEYVQVSTPTQLGEKRGRLIASLAFCRLWKM